ncbi:CAP domain-containing protein [Burkholderia stagnalis]|uniref:CAP domain-containing protein n=1 Tax=Burkholderia stagnalis TaxID=1503054 RepID=UPI000ACC1FDA|nr:CAP domain-containing protein [Burkholderia stagnalis]
MQKSTTIFRSILSLTAILSLGACGGDDISSAVPGTLETPNYDRNSIHTAILNQLNLYRTRCGFPALKQNTILDQAASAHALYQAHAAAHPDAEIAGNTGFTGVTYADRAAHFGFPKNSIGWGVSSDNYYLGSLDPNTPLTLRGSQIAKELVSDVYQLASVMFPVDTIGIGEYKTESMQPGRWPWDPMERNTHSWISMSLLNTTTQTLAGAPLTFPCEGMMGMSYFTYLRQGAGYSEVPPPPHGDLWYSAAPVVVMGNYTDTVRLESASMSSPSGAVNLQILNSDTDPNHRIGKYQAVAYPPASLNQGTNYSVQLNGTINGTPFSRSFTFKTDGWW